MRYPDKIIPEEKEQAMQTMLVIQKHMFLKIVFLKIFQDLQENTCAGVYFQ